MRCRPLLLLLCWASVAAAPGRVLAAEEPLPSFADVCYQDFDDAQPYPDRTAVEKLLEPLRDPTPEMKVVSHRFHYSSRDMCQISGRFRLKAAWQPDSAWRVSLLATAPYRLHFWNGQRGVTLIHAPELYRTWAAFGTTRSDNRPLPETLDLWATDNDRYRRTGAGTVEVRVQAGQLVLTRGDVVLLVVPFDGLPQEVIVDGEVRVRGLEMIRSGPVSIPALQPRPAVLEGKAPATLDWSDKLPEGCELHRLDDGRVELFKREKAGSVFLRGPECPEGLHELIFELEDFDAGTGVYLVDAQGKDLGRLAFWRQKDSGRTIVGPMPNWSTTADVPETSTKHIARLAAKHQWVRIVLAGGQMTYWVSGDGQHWSWPAGFPMVVNGACRSVGLFCLSGGPQRSIKLRSLAIRRFERLPALVPEALRHRGDFSLSIDNVATWDKAVTAAQPAGVAADAWEAACEVRGLELGVSLKVSQTLLDRLLRRQLARPGSVEDKLSLLNEALEFYDMQEWAAGGALPTYLDQLAQQLIAEGDPAPFSRLRPGLLRLHVWTREALPVGAPELLRRELLNLAAAEHWPAAAALLRRLQYYGWASRFDASAAPWGDEAQYLLGWVADELVRRGLLAAGAVHSRQSWRHPLIESVNKEAFNFLAELRAALEANANREACQLISTMPAAGLAGLTPSVGDRRLLVSLPAAVAMALDDAPTLRAAMEENVGPLGLLRLKQAMADDDVAAMQAITVQFYSTRAATDACRWLGDRALSQGDFRKAREAYRQALAGLDEPARDAVTARLKLAEAMLGQNVDRRPTAPVEIGGAKLSSAEFARLLDDARRTRQKSADLLAATVGPAPRPGQYQPRTWATWDYPLLKRAPGVAQARNDWQGRQLAAVAGGETLIASNQFDLAAFDLTTGHRRWMLPRDCRDATSRWPMTPMQPILTGSHVFARRITDNGPELVCAEVATGKLLWRSRPGDYAASDPVMVGGRLLLLAATSDGMGKLSLGLVEIEASSGRVVRQAPLVDLLDYCSGAVNARVLLTGDQLLITTAGSVVCCDLAGQLRWSRRQQWIRPPPSDDATKTQAWWAQQHLPPLADQQRGLLTQPGVWSVECVDLETGRMQWRQPVPDLVAAVALTADRVVVKTAAGWLGLDVEDGSVCWRHEAVVRGVPWCDGTSGRLMFVRLEPRAERGPPQPVLTWLDLGDGHVLGECPLDLGARLSPLGPLLYGGPRPLLLVPDENRPDRCTIDELDPRQ